MDRPLLLMVPTLKFGRQIIGRIATLEAMAVLAAVAARSAMLVIPEEAMILFSHRPQPALIITRTF